MLLISLDDSSISYHPKSEEQQPPCGFVLKSSRESEKELLEETILIRDEKVAVDPFVLEYPQTMGETDYR